ncbi:MAG: glycoside hydrolase family 78 protein [Bacteroidales bacterium]|nr:glycoside hydrolase family 78 protein [Bacteroidales bacterium]
MKITRTIALCLLLAVTATLRAELSITSLKTDYITNPAGIDNTAPKLSWIIHSNQMNTMQDSYEIRAALSMADLKKGKNLLWKTGQVPSSQSLHVKYAGPPLESFQRVYWQVKIKDNHGKSSGWSEVAYWEMGILSSADWKADWISPLLEEDSTISMPSPYLRKEFNLNKGVRKARLYISSHGLYQVEINSERIGDQEFTPGWTSYDTRLQYQTYDVTENLQQEANAIGIILGDGWYRGNLGWGNNRNEWGTQLSVIAQLIIQYTDGSEEIIYSDDSWKAGTGPILKSDIYNGETYDATKELDGWSSSGYNDTEWQKTVTVDISKEKLIAPEGPPVRIIDELAPVSIQKTGNDQWQVDMGQNMVGWIRIKATGKKGDIITLKHTEVLDKEGNMYYDNLRKAQQTNTYILKGDEREVFEPHFSFQGFRYVMVSGYPGILHEEDIRGMVIHSDMEPSGSFTCSDPLINQLQHNIVWGLKGNFLDVPTDCPQRDERLGWTGDAQVFAPTACFNMNAATFYTKWLKDLMADQAENGSIPHVIPNILGGGGATGWADAGVVIPLVLYLDYGDISILETQYESMKKWIGYMKDRAGDDLIWDEDGHFGDWLSFDASRSDYMGAYTTKDLIATAYYSYSSGLVSKVASILGQADDEKYYGDLSNQVKEAFQDEFVTPNGRLVAHTQTAYTLALAFDLLDEETAVKSASHLGKDVQDFGHITTGFLGTPLISLTLTDHGMNDLAYLLLNRTEYPSWLYPVTMGATTIWERWDGQKPDSTFQTPGMNSFNHYAYGAIGKWLYQVVAGIGIDPDRPGYKHTIIHPRPGGGLTSAEATHNSMYGTIVSGWKLDGDRLFMEIEIPANTSATIHIPGSSEDILINGAGLDESGLEYRIADGKVIGEAGSGNYKIHTTIY